MSVIITYPEGGIVMLHSHDHCIEHENLVITLLHLYDLYGLYNEIKEILTIQNQKQF